MYKKTKITLILTLTMLFLMFSFNVNAVPTPVGVGGYVTKNNISLKNVQITITNLNNDYTDIKYTNNEGIYACGITASDGHTIQIKYVENGKTYTDTIIVDTDKNTQWLNLSITDATKPDPKPNPPPSQPPVPSNKLPSASFMFNPNYPVTDEKVFFVDTSTKGTYEITEWLWNIDGTTKNTRDINHIFINSGNYPVSLKVTDTKGNYDIYTLSISIAEKTVENVSENKTIIENITINLKTPEPNKTVSIYQNDIFYDNVTTDENGTAVFTLQKNSYTFIYDDEEITTDTNADITFTYSQDGINNVDKTETMDLLVMTAIFLIIISISIILAYFILWRCNII